VRPEPRGCVAGKAFVSSEQEARGHLDAAVNTTTHTHTHTHTHTPHHTTPHTHHTCTNMHQHSQAHRSHGPAESCMCEYGRSAHQASHQSNVISVHRNRSERQRATDAIERDNSKHDTHELATAVDEGLVTLRLLLRVDA
jgi:hypothetical protein